MPCDAPPIHAIHHRRNLAIPSKIRNEKFEIRHSYDPSVAEINSPTFLALLGGVLPALFWLWFWLREDRLHPEPRRIILECFVLGGAGAFLALVLEKSVQSLGTAT